MEIGQVVRKNSCGTTAGYLTGRVDRHENLPRTTEMELFVKFFDARHIMQLSDGFPWETISESRFPDPMSNHRVAHST